MYTLSYNLLVVFVNFRIYIFLATTITTYQTGGDGAGGMVHPPPGQPAYPIKPGGDVPMQPYGPQPGYPNTGPVPAYPMQPGIVYMFENLMFVLNIAIKKKKILNDC